MRRTFLRIRDVAFFAICLSLSLIPACSVQKSGSKVDASQAGEEAKSAQRLARKQFAESTTPIRINYLTPVSAIKNPEIYIYKEKRRLYVIQSNVLVRDYPIGLGFNPVGDKVKQGDGRTPEGEFFVCMKNPNSRFIKSIGLTYPDRKHAERALFAGLITPGQFREIVMAAENKRLPPWNTALGGQIFIHAGGAHKDWTEGCIALYNRDMDELFKIASLGTPVFIRP